MQEFGLNQQISDRHIQEFSNSHGRMWKDMPTYLGLHRFVAMDIDHIQNSEHHKTHSFFTTWKQMKGSSATYKALIFALLEVDCLEDAESVCKLVPEDPFVEASRLGIAVPEAASPLSENFSVSMTPGQLHDWLKSKQVPPADCKRIKGMYKKCTLANLIKLIAT